MTVSTFILISIAALVLVAIVWRLASRRQSLPCPVWLRWMVELDNPFTQSNRAGFIVGTLGLAKGMTVLDAGCGPGRLTLPLALGVGPSGRVVALDIQPGMLARAKTKTDAAGCVNVEFVAAALGDGKLPADRFDRVVLVTVLGEIPDQGAVDLTPLPVRIIMPASRCVWATYTAEHLEARLDIPLVFSARAPNTQHYVPIRDVSSPPHA